MSYNSDPKSPTLTTFNSSLLPMKKSLKSDSMKLSLLHCFPPYDFSSPLSESPILPVHTLASPSGFLWFPHVPAIHSREGRGDVSEKDQVSKARVGRMLERVVMDDGQSKLLPDLGPEG